jgi:hypothetical protein
MNRPRLASVRAAVAVAMAAVILASCSDNDGAIARDTTTSSTTRRSTTTTSTDPGDAVEAEIAAAYETASRAFIEAAAIPDPDFPAFIGTHVGPMLEQRREVLTGLRADGRAIRYPPNSQYRIEVQDVEIDGEVARLDVCVVDDGERVVVSTGDVVAGGIGTVQARAAMQLVDGEWRLAERTQEAEWEGVAGCAVE